MKYAELKNFDKIRGLSESQARLLSNIQQKIITYKLAYNTMKISYDAYILLIDDMFEVPKENNEVFEKEFDSLRDMAYKILVT